ncbi:hypothetical protein MZA86_09275 [Haemophilus influenzae]
MKNWVTAKEIAGIGGLSKHPTNVNRLARKKNGYSEKFKVYKEVDTNTPSPLFL